MNLLAIEIGNTRVKLVRFDGDRPADRWWLETRDEALTAPDGSAGASLVPAAHRDAWTIDAVAIASVVPRLTAVLRRAVVDALGIEPTILHGASLATVMRVGVDSPEHVGVDRLLNGLGVHALFGGPSIAVDVGTAATFDVVAADGTYLGGAIAPGPGIMRDALHESTAQLPLVDLERPAGAIGGDTVSAMRSGLVNGYVGLVSGLLAALRGELVERSGDGARVHVALTGGYAAAAWLRDLPGIDAIDPDLTIRGISIAHARLAAAAEVAR